MVNINGGRQDTHERIILRTSLNSITIRAEQELRQVPTDLLEYNRALNDYLIT